ncbi:MAG: sigma-70 family RNA polymerase sigma factor [Anaerolineaceae bacterium]|jgi:RNA polymerase sigma-70 factor (ECF subfamily)
MTDTHDDEITLIEQAKREPEAFGLLYEKYINRIYNYIYFRVGSVQDAEDLTTRVFIKAFDNIGRYRNMGLPFSAWLYRIAHNQVANFHRDKSRAREISIDEMLVPPPQLKTDHPEISVLQQESISYLMGLINDLNPDKRELLMLKFVQKLSNEEIAQALGRTEGAIKSLYHRTLLELRDQMTRLDNPTQRNANDSVYRVNTLLDGDDE